MEQQDSATPKIILPGEGELIDPKELLGPDGLPLIREGQEIPEPVVEPVVDTAVEPAKPEKKIYSASIIDATQLAEAQARDIADAKMTESKNDRSQNWFKRTFNRVWQHNLAQEYYRQKAINEARNEIIASNNIYAGEKGATEDDHKAAMGSIIERFTSEYDAEMLKKDEHKEASNEQLNTAIATLIKSYANNPEMDKDAFTEERNRILSAFQKEYAVEGIARAENLFEVAEKVRNSVEGAVDHEEKMKALDFEVNLTLGKARESLNTEMSKHTFDRAIEKMQNSKVGRWAFNEPGAVLLAAGIYSGLKTIFTKTLSSKAAKWASFGGTALLAGGVSAVKERARLERERVQDARERAKGVTFKKNMERRQEMAESHYDTIDAAETIASLEQSLTTMASVDTGSLESIEQHREAIVAAKKHLIDLEARMAIGSQRQIDLITYSSATSIEVEQTKINLYRARLKAALKSSLGDEAYKATISDEIKKYKKGLLGGDEGIDEKDKIFSKMKTKKVLKAFLKTALIGAAAGVIGQEIKSAFDPSQAGLFDHSGVEKHTTVLEGIRRSIWDPHTRIPMGHTQEIAIGTNHVRLPEGVTLHHTADGHYELLREGEVIDDKITLDFTSSGDLTEASKTLLHQHDIFTDTAMIAGHSPESAVNYLHEHPELTTKVHRQLFYDNDTPHPFDKNELKTEWVGKKIPLLNHAGKVIGERGSGIDEKGNFVFNIKGMTADGSYHHGASVDVTSAVKHQGVMKMAFSLSKDTQHTPIMVDIDANGNAIIDPHSELAKLMFKVEGDHVNFLGKYAEVVQLVGKNPTGGENIRVLSTVIGEGRQMVGGSDPSIITTLNVPDKWDYDVPLFIPVPLARQPLERAKRVKAKATSPTNDIITEPGSGVVDAIYQPENGFHAETDAAQAAEVPAGGFRAEQKELKPISQEEYNALKDDVAFLNKKIQASEGVVTVEQIDLKSEYARKRYLDLAHIADGKPVSFNKKELATMGDEVETMLSNSKIATPLQEVLQSIINPKTVPVPENLPVGPGADDESLNRIIYKILKEQDLSPKELEVFYANEDLVEQRVKTRNLIKSSSELNLDDFNLDENVSREDAMGMFKTSDEIIARDYFMFTDVTEHGGVIKEYYDNSHTKRGALKPQMRKYANEIRELKKQDKEAVFENAAESLVSYIENTLGKIGAPVHPYAKSKSWAYFDLAKMQYHFDHPGQDEKLNREKDTTGDVLSWKEKGNKQGVKLMQYIADQELGTIASMLDKTLVDKVLEKNNTSERAERIRFLLKKREGYIPPAHHLAELGRLIREEKNIPGITTTPATKGKTAAGAVSTPEAVPTVAEIPEVVEEPETKKLKILTSGTSSSE